jgi:hypothetical protein
MEWEFPVFASLFLSLFEDVQRRLRKLPQALVLISASQSPTNLVLFPGMLCCESFLLNVRRLLKVDLLVINLRGHSAGDHLEVLLLRNAGMLVSNSRFLTEL